MEYQKPTVVFSCSALGAIRGACEKGGFEADTAGSTCGNNPHSVISAYEADE
jgi:hypothetical protein